MNFIKWVFRGLVSRLAMMASVVPFPVHRRDPKVSAKFQVEPSTEQSLPPVPAETEGAPDDHHRPPPTTDFERGTRSR
ncbi:MAG: hypothetical protein O2798_05920 [Chloroflexi bacterium]|nr:hypothetical protein [Chloroflexota bacterium]MDA1240366.1 hypothetical protein [Chloroflexota bacterium]